MDLTKDEYSKVELALLWIQKDFEVNGEDTGLAELFFKEQNISMDNYIEYANKGLRIFFSRIGQEPKYILC